LGSADGSTPVRTYMARAANIMRTTLKVKIVEMPVARQIIMDTMPSLGQIC
jgi:hypothetical protein